MLHSYLTLTQCEAASAISRFTWYKMAARGEVVSEKQGGKIVIPTRELVRVLASG
jgi:hypothetical protein